MKDGGPAFPVQGKPGMTIRDWFAGQALAMFPRINDMDDLDNAYDMRSDIATFAYAMADSLISQREKENKKQDEEKA